MHSGSRASAGRSKRPRSADYDEDESKRTRNPIARVNHYGLRVGRDKTSRLDAHAGVGMPMPVMGYPDLTYSVGGPETGGAAAERVLNQVDVDKSVVLMRDQYEHARRFVLMNCGRAVAAAVVEVQQAPSLSTEAFLEVPILAASRTDRQRGYGSVLHALISEIGMALGIKIIIVSATAESKRFWQRAGYHALTHCEPPIAAVLRALTSSGMSDGFHQTTRMARALPSCEEANALVRAALESAGRSSPDSGLSAEQAAKKLGYHDLSGTAAMLFVRDGRTGRRVPVSPALNTAAQLQLTIDVPLRKLRAIPTAGAVSGVPPPGGWGDAGWGVRSTAKIKKGQVVCEVGGELLDEARFTELGALEANHFCAALDEAAHRRSPYYKPSSASTPLAYVDMREAGSLARLVRPCIEAPNLELVVTAAASERATPAAPSAPAAP